MKSRPPGAPLLLETVLAEIDPTENALATIASILDHHEPARKGEIAAGDGKASAAEQATEAAGRSDGEDELHLPAAEPIAAEGYSRVGPGPMSALRFKWTVHRGDNGQFYVHETIGESLAPIVTGPFTADEAVRAVDQQDADTREHFEALRSELSGRGAWAPPARRGSQG